MKSSISIVRDDLTKPGTLKNAGSNHIASGGGDNWSWDNTIPLSLRTPTASPAQPPVVGQSPLQRCRILRQMIDDSISDPPLPTGTFLSPVHDTQSCGLSDSAHKDIKPHHAAGERKEKGDNTHRHKGDEWEDKEAGCTNGSITATGIRDSSKRTADSAGLNKGGERAYRSEKIQRIGKCAGLHYRKRI